MHRRLDHTAAEECTAVSIYTAATLGSGLGPQGGFWVFPYRHEASRLCLLLVVIAVFRFSCWCVVSLPHRLGILRVDDTFWPIYLSRHVHDVDGGRLHDLVGGCVWFLS